MLEVFENGGTLCRHQDFLLGAYTLDYFDGNKMISLGTHIGNIMPPTRVHPWSMECLVDYVVVMGTRISHKKGTSEGHRCEKRQILTKSPAGTMNEARTPLLSLEHQSSRLKCSLSYSLVCLGRSKYLIQLHFFISNMPDYSLSITQYLGSRTC